EFTGVNPLRIDQQVCVQVPAFVLTCDFEAVKSAKPVVGEFASSQLCETIFEPLKVCCREVSSVAHCQYDVLWLLDLVCPPANGKRSFTGQHGLANRAIKVLAAIPECLD